MGLEIGPSGGREGFRAFSSVGQFSMASMERNGRRGTHVIMINGYGFEGLKLAI